MADEKFRLPRSSYDELVKIIKAYGRVKEPTGLDDMTTLSALHKTIISRNVGFLVAVGILESGQKKMPTPLGRSLAQALEHELPGEIRRYWQQVVENNDFLSRIVSAISIRNGMDQQTLEAHIAYSAGQPKTNPVMTGARTIADLLTTAGIITESDGKIIVQSDEVADEIVEKVEATEVEGAQLTEFQVSHERKGLSLVVNVNINVSCTPDDLVELGQKLRSVINDLQDLEEHRDTEE